MVGGQHWVDERKQAEQVRVTQMNASERDERCSRTEERVCSNKVTMKEKKLLTSVGVVRDCPSLGHNRQSAKADLFGWPSEGPVQRTHECSFLGRDHIGGDNAGTNWRYRETVLPIDAGPSGMTRMGYVGSIFQIL